MQQAPERHYGYICSNCRAVDFMGRRYSCWICFDYQICGICFDGNQFPNWPQHKYYHTLEAYYTQSEYRLFFGNEASSEDQIPQSYKCAICLVQGFSTPNELYIHLTGFHSDHPDFNAYSEIVFERRSLEAAHGLIHSLPSEISGGTRNAETSTGADINHPMSTGYGNRIVPRIELEVVRPELATSGDYPNGVNSTAMYMVDAALRLVGELNILQPRHPDFLKRSFFILMEARGLRSQLLQLPSEHLFNMGLRGNAPERILRIIERGVAVNIARHRQFNNSRYPNSSRVIIRIPSVSSLSRRHGISPGSMAASAAVSFAALERVLSRPVSSYISREAYNPPRIWRNYDNLDGFPQQVAKRPNPLNSTPATKSNSQKSNRNGEREPKGHPALLAVFDKAKAIYTETNGESPGKPYGFTPKAKSIKKDIRLLCPKLEPTAKKPPRTSMKMSKHFIEAIFCSMLVDEELSQVPHTIIPTEKDFENKIHKIIPDTKIAVIEEPKANNYNTEIDLMYRFYKGLNIYKQKLIKFSRGANSATQDNGIIETLETSPSHLLSINHFFNDMQNDAQPIFIYESEEDGDEDDEEDSNAMNQNNVSLNSNNQIESVDMEDEEDEEDEGEGEEEDYEDDASYSEFSDSQLVDSLEHAFDY